MIAEANFIFVSGWEDVVEGKGRCKENDDSGGPEKEDRSTPQRLFATSCPPATLTHLVECPVLPARPRKLNAFGESAERRIIKDTVVR